MGFGEGIGSRSLAGQNDGIDLCREFARDWRMSGDRHPGALAQPAHARHGMSTGMDRGRGRRTLHCGSAAPPMPRLRELVRRQIGKLHAQQNKHVAIAGIDHHVIPDLL